MSLTQDDLQAIGEVMRSLVKEEVNALRANVEKRFDQVDHKLEAIDKVLDDLVKFTTEDMNELHENHEDRIKALEQAQSIP